MENKVGHEGAQPSQPSSPTSQDLDQQYRRQREGPDSNQSNHRQGIDDTSAADDNNSNSSGSSSSQENLERLIEQLFLQQIDRQIEEDALHDNVSDDDETVEEESLVSAEGSNSNSQDDQNQQGTYTVAVFFPNEDGVRRRQYGTNMLLLLNPNVGPLDVDGMSHEELMELGERIGMVQRGLPKETISSHLKTRVHTTSADSTEEKNEICTICQDGYENKDKIATLDCQHEYHEDCIT
ncbi:uncharacterized protein LOC113332298 [Papaver somniferum]|uniref:uncharacterized protein LOC113332298 n=1 Tax=Papaver somniferum TaxID=3469 RepID=UPI000E6FC50C|nr:uncharacterized protein LOC113332298 [Papaver somniferum]